MQKLYKEYLLNIVLSKNFKVVLFKISSIQKGKELINDKCYILKRRDNNTLYKGKLHIEKDLYFFIFDEPQNGFRWNNGVLYELLDNNESVAFINEGIDEMFIDIIDFSSCYKDPNRFHRFKYEYAPKEIFPLTGYYDEFVDKYYSFEEFLLVLKEKPEYINEYRSYIRYMDKESLYKEEQDLIDYLFEHKDEYLITHEEYQGDNPLEKIVHDIKEDNKPRHNVFECLDMPVITYFHLEDIDTRIKKIIDQVNGRTRSKRNSNWGKSYNDAEAYIKKHPELVKVIPYKHK